jgi:ribonucleoside-diphosphate reductase alpha chain
MDTIATMTSVSLQYGVPLRDLVNKFAHVRFEPAGFTGNSEIPIAKSIVDYVFRWMGSRFLPASDREALGLIGDAPMGGIAFGGALNAAPAAAPAPAAAAPAVTSPVGDEPMLDQGAVPVAPVAAAAFPLPVLNGNGHTNGNGHGTGSVATASLGATTKVSFSVSADSPSCADCGSIMVRNGSCYKCLNCGSTSGCS